MIESRKFPLDTVQVRLAELASQHEDLREELESIAKILSDASIEELVHELVNNNSIDDVRFYVERASDWL